MARPTKLDEQIIIRFSTVLELTGSLETAIAKCQLGRETFFRWQRLVKVGKGTKLQKKLIREAESAMAEFKRKVELSIFAAGRKNWQAMAWLAQRKWPKEYGNNRLSLDTNNPDQETAKPVSAKFSLNKPEWAQPSSTQNTEQSSPDGSTTTPPSTPRDDSTTVEQDTRDSADQ